LAPFSSSPPIRTLFLDGLETHFFLLRARIGSKSSVSFPLAKKFFSPVDFKEEAAFFPSRSIVGLFFSVISDSHPPPLEDIHYPPAKERTPPAGNAIFSEVNFRGSFRAGMATLPARPLLFLPSRSGVSLPDDTALFLTGHARRFFCLVGVNPSPSLSTALSW